MAFITSFLTWLSEDIWVSHSHSSCEVIASVLCLKLPCDELRLLRLQRHWKCNTFCPSKTTALIFCDLDRNSDWTGIVRIYSRTEKDKFKWPEILFWLGHARWDAGGHEHSDYLRNPSPQSVLGHPEIEKQKTKKMNFFRQNNSITALKPKADGLETLMFDLVLAVIIRLQMLHVKSIVGRTDSTQVQSMTDLEANTY